MEIIWREIALKYKDLNTGDVFLAQDTGEVCMKTDLDNYDNDVHSYEAVNLGNGMTTAFLPDAPVQKMLVRLMVEDV